MSIRTKIAHWLAPHLKAEQAETAAKLANSNAAIDEMTSTLVKHESANQNLVNKLGDAAATITKLRETGDTTGGALAIGLEYVKDALDDVEEQLGKLGPKSAKRAALEATSAAIKEDIAAINAAIEAVGK